MPFKAQYSQEEVRKREDLIIKYIIGLINDTHAMPNIIPYFLNYGIFDWSWPLRFVNGNQLYKGYKYYSYSAYEAVQSGQTSFTRDHYFPKKRLKQMLLNLENPDASSVRKILEKYGEVCVITRNEDESLKNAGLRNDMPLGWNIGDDVFARYHEVGIRVKENSSQWQ